MAETMPVEPSEEFKIEVIKRANRYACRGGRPFNALAIEKHAYEKGAMAAYKIIRSLLAKE